MSRKHEHMKADADRTTISTDGGNIFSDARDHPRTDQKDDIGTATREKAIKDAMVISREKHAKILEELAKS